MSAGPRILVASPDKGEVVQVSEWLEAEGFEFVPVGTAPSATRRLQEERFDVLIMDAAFARDGQLHGTARAMNPRIQVVVLGNPGTAGRIETFCLSRPLDRVMLLCHVTMAVVEARPVRRSPRKALSRFEAVVEGMPAYLVDVSKDGLRLEIPRERPGALPPHFTVRIPLLGIALTVRRVWMSTAPGAGGAAWCGATLHETHPRAEQNWRAFVETVPAR